MDFVLSISKCADNCKVKYVACTFQGEALTLWNLQVQTLGLETAHQISWNDLKEMLRNKYRPRNELQKIEEELWHHKMVDDGIVQYATRFHELCMLVLHMVTPDFKRIDRFIWGLVPQIQGMVTAVNHTTIQSAVQLAHNLTDQAVRTGSLGKTQKDVDQDPKGKRKWDGNSGRNVKLFVATTENAPYAGNNSKCNKCGMRHKGSCDFLVFFKCKKPSHTSKNFRSGESSTIGAIKGPCYECGAAHHYRRECPKLKNNDLNQARGRAFVLGTRDA
jgi:hypothetical protein